VHRSSVVSSIVLFFLWNMACSAAYAQASGSFIGVVTDSTGSVIPGAAVTVVSQQTGLSRLLKTDSTGHFTAPLLPAGVYTIRVDSQGFQEVSHKDLTLQVEQTREVDFTLVPSSVQQQVQVSATEVQVQTSNPTLGQVINSQQVADLPLNGRDFVQLATLMPGTVRTTDPNSFFNGGSGSEVTLRGSVSLSVGGSRENDTDWRLDGVDNNELTAGGIAILPSIDAIQEFKVQTYNYSAEYGVRGGPTVLVTLKSGTNGFHGSVFEFLRNTVLDASSFFSPQKTEFIQNQFGGSFGGPIRKDKTFFFINVEDKRLRQGETFLAQVPTKLMRQGIFTESFPGAPAPTIYNPFSTRTDPVTGQLVRDPFPGNQIPGPMLDPIAVKLLNLFPLPNVPGVLSGNYVSSPVKTINELQFDVRLDHHFSKTDSGFARFAYDQASSFQPSGLPDFGSGPGSFPSNETVSNHGRNYVASETHIFTPTSINTFTFGYNRIFDFISSFGDGTNKSAELGIPGSNLFDGVSDGLVATTFTGGFWSVGDRGFAPFVGGTSIYHIQESFDAVRGPHNLKIGGEWRANQLNSLTDAWQNGLYVFDNLFTAGFSQGSLNNNTGSPIASILLSLPVELVHDYLFKGTTVGRRWKMLRPYIEDEWRVRRSLTLTLGLAYNLTSPTIEASNRQSNFDFPTGNFFIAGINSGARVGQKWQTTDFEPRLGFAWSPSAARRWAIRGGYGIFHSSGWNQGTQGLWLNPPYEVETNIFGDDIHPSSTVPLAQGFTTPTFTPDPSQFFGNVSSQPLNAKLGFIQQYNLNVQNELPRGFLLTLAYAGSRFSHLMTTNFNLNTAPPNTVGVDPPQLRPFPQYTDVTCFCDRGQGKYDSAQVKLETTSTKYGLYLLSAYTYSKGFDNGLWDQLGTPTSVPYFPLSVPYASDKGLAETQLKHNFITSGVFDIPVGRGKRFGSSLSGLAQGLLGNWQTNAIAKLTSGFPIFINTASNNSGTNLAGNGGSPGLNRPNRICNGQLTGSQRSVNEWFNTSCFTDPAPGTLGDSTRTPLYGPNFINFDFSVFKTFPIRETAKIEFRSEFFNIFNHPQFANPGAFEGSAGFGQITYTVNNPRLIQFALKIIF
jgi:hypothetical protein